MQTPRTPEIVASMIIVGSNPQPVPIPGLTDSVPHSTFVTNVIDTDVTEVI